jgi:monofunctional glycosyltransferase
MKYNAKSIPRTLARVAVRVLLAYAVLFSIVGTIALAVLFRMVWQPVAAVKRLRTENPEQTVFMAVFRENLRKSGRADTLFHEFTPIDSISPHLINAVIAAEDDDFYVHPGFDLPAILKAYEYNTARGRIVRGASTLTQQLAKNLFLSNERTFGRKYRELGFTLLMEHFLGKKRIMELYLNYAQWGKNLFGCEAASRFYFKKPSGRLTQYEAVRLAAVLAMPAKLSPLNPDTYFMQQRIVMINNNIFLKNRSHSRQGAFPVPAEDTLRLPGEDTVLTSDDSAIIEEKIRVQDSLISRDTLAGDSTKKDSTGNRLSP